MHLPNLLKAAPNYFLGRGKTPSYKKAEYHSLVFTEEREEKKFYLNRLKDEARTDSSFKKYLSLFELGIITIGTTKDSSWFALLPFTELLRCYFHNLSKKRFNTIAQSLIPEFTHDLDDLIEDSVENPN